MSFYIYSYKSSFPCFWSKPYGANRSESTETRSLRIRTFRCDQLAGHVLSAPGDSGARFFDLRVGLMAPHVIGMFSILGSIHLHSFNATRGGTTEFSNWIGQFPPMLQGRYSGLLTGEWTYRVVFFGSSDTYDCHLICQIKPHLHGFRNYINLPSETLHDQMKTYCSGAGCLEKTIAFHAFSRFNGSDSDLIGGPLPHHSHGPIWLKTLKWSPWKNKQWDMTCRNIQNFFSGKSFSCGDILAGYFGICQPWSWQKLWCTEISGTSIHLPYCDLDEGHEWFCWFHPHLMCANWYFPWLKKKHVEFYVHIHTVTYICTCIYIYICIYTHTCTYTYMYTQHTHIPYYILYTYIWHMNATILIGFPDVAFPKGPTWPHTGAASQSRNINGFEPSMNQSSP